jgi:hypothetical protein
MQKKFKPIKIDEHPKQVKRDKHANSIVIACLKRLLPVGLNVFGGRELDIVQQSKERFLAKESEDKVREFIRARLVVTVVSVKCRV